MCVHASRVCRNEVWEAFSVSHAAHLRFGLAVVLGLSVQREIIEKSLATWHSVTSVKKSSIPMYALFGHALNALDRRRTMRHRRVFEVTHFLNHGNMLSLDDFVRRISGPLPRSICKRFPQATQLNRLLQLVAVFPASSGNVAAPRTEK